MVGSFRWGERATNLANVSSEKVIKLAKFFSQLPMFCKDESWYDGKIALPDYQLDESMETVYGKDDKLNKLETVRSIVRRLCEFPCADDDSVADLSGQVVNSNGYLNGPVTLEPVEAAKRSYSFSLPCIFQHTKVIRSPDHIRRQIHRELETCMLTHIDHEEDNARFYAQQREQEASSEYSYDTPSRPGIKIIPFSYPRSTYYYSVRNNSADNSHSPFTYLYFSCLAAPKPGEPFSKVCANTIFQML
ncbi:hypothetical protein NHQ30_001498 [Ciborinia camelliae]|nr:hypothetical protein NHQ30_001498 [Ciborinia camelliae]